MQWYYLSDTHERIALSEAQFPALAARGLLRPTTPVWRKGLSGWIACGEVKPEIFAAGVATDKGRHYGLSDNAAVKGTVTGLSRTLAEYRPWYWIVGGFCLLASAALVVLLVWQAWTWAKHGVASLDKGYLFMDQVSTWPWILWLVMGMEFVTSFLAACAGCLLLSGAGAAKTARDSGSEVALAFALQKTGRFFIVCVVALLVNAVVWISLSLWLGWDKAFPTPGAKPASKVSV